VTDEDEDFLGAGDTGGGRGAASLDPLEAFESFGDRLLAAADAAYTPTEAAVGRVVTVMGGLKAKPAFRAVAGALASFTKALTGKVDNLRVAAGFPSTEGVSGAVAGVVVGGAGGEDGSTGAAAQLAESWARRLEESDIRGRELVSGALRALQAAGRLTRKMRALEAVASDALGELSSAVFKEVAIDRAVALITSHHQLQQAAGSAPPSAGIASMGVGAIFANCVLQSDIGAASELRSFLNASASHHASQTVFAAVNAPLARLKITAGGLLFDLCTAAPEKMLADLHTEDVWTQGGVEYTKGASGSGGESEGGMDLALVDSLLPLPAITQVGEHLLSLVQELETFASSDALPDLLCMMGDAQTVELAARGWRRLKGLLEDKDVLGGGREVDFEGVDQLCRRSTCGAAVVAAEKLLFGMQLSRVVEDVVAEGGGEDPEADAEAAALGFVNEWLGAVADSTVGLVVAQWLQVSSLSPSGRAQLVVDLEYISNVVHAMGLRQHPLLVHLRQFLLKDPQTLITALEAAPARTPVAVMLHKMEGKISHALAVGHGLTQR
jgi:hypothetical protein